PRPKRALPERFENAAGTGARAWGYLPQRPGGLSLGLRRRPTGT
ncbi:MAG: hypothetical protein QOG66_2717, partial [Methylobacteriaceae bacterium]|nr:hypothetical protein [Methylobacteriaceae bacterium]